MGTYDPKPYELDLTECPPGSNGVLGSGCKISILLELNNE